MSGLLKPNTVHQIHQSIVNIYTLDPIQECAVQ